MKRMITFVLTLGIAATACAGILDEISDGPIVTNQWNSNFRAGKLYAEEHKLPLMLVYASDSCSYCTTFNKALESPEVQKWLSEHEIVLIYKLGDQKAREAALSKNGATSKYPDFWAARQWLNSLNSGLTGYPFVGLYRENGVDSDVAMAFTGRTSEIPNYLSRRRSLSEMFVGVLNEVFDNGKYDPEDPEPEPTPSEGFGYVEEEYDAGLLEQGGSTVAAMHVTTGLANRSGNVKITCNIVLRDGQSKKLTGYADVDNPSIDFRIPGYGVLTLQFNEDGLAGSMGDYTVVKSDSYGGELEANPSTVELAEDFPREIDGREILVQFLPVGETVETNSRGKWVLQKSTGTVKWDKASGEFVATGDNPSKLKLTYTPSKGTFKGSFYVYSPVYKYNKDGSVRSVTIRKTAATVTGFVLEGRGLGQAVIRGLGTYAFKIQ